MYIIVFDKNVRVYERMKSLSKLPLVVDDNVNPLDNVEISYEPDKIRVFKSGEQSKEIPADAEWLYIGDAIGLYGDESFSSAIELILCDNAIAVKLIKGSITMCPEKGNPEVVLKLETGVSNTVAPYINDLKMLNSDSFVNYCKYFGDLARQYTYDYCYQLQLRGAGGRTPRVDIIKQGILDISMGKLAAIIKRREEQERMKEIKKSMSYFNNEASSTVVFDSYTDSNNTESSDEEDEMYNY